MTEASRQSLLEIIKNASLDKLVWDSSDPSYFDKLCLFESDNKKEPNWKLIIKPVIKE